jgi:hypothetical protein
MLGPTIGMSACACGVVGGTVRRNASLSEHRPNSRRSLPREIKWKIPIRLPPGKATILIYRTCAFFASNPQYVASSSTLIGRLELAEPEELSEDSTLRKLHYEISESLLSNRLLHLAIMLRTYDDMMSANDSDGAYTAHVQRSSGKGTFSLPDACNKIIHASEIRPLYEGVYKEHEESLASRSAGN